MKFVLFVLAAMMQPVVEAVHAPQVMDWAEIVPENVVMVQVVPPTQVAPSIITSSAEVGAAAPVAPPEPTDDHMMPVVMPSLFHVHVVAHTAQRFAACARSGARNASARKRTPKRYFFMATYPE